MSKETLETFDNTMKELENLSEDAMNTISANTPWQSYSDPNTEVDEDGFPVLGFATSENMYKNFQAIQDQCWVMFNQDVFVSTTLEDKAGRLAGYGFEITSSEAKLQEIITDVWEDGRNDLVNNFKKYMVRSEVQGELFLVMTLHKDGFVEVDFLSPTVIKGFKDNSGILSHPDKPMMPLMYRVQTDNPSKTQFIPSINLAYYPEMWSKVDNTVTRSKILGKKPGFAKTKGYTKFIVEYNQGFVTKRNLSKVKTVLEWLNLYKNLKLWEADHKKSSGSYLWTIEMEDKAALRMWLSMTEEEQKATGLTAKKTPGGTLILPPGFKMTCNNPKLSTISGQDDDILRMVSAGMNVPDDVMTGSSSGTTYGGAKESRGPLSDRTFDSIADLERYLIHHFWKGVFFLHGTVKKMPKVYKVNEAVKLENGEPKFKMVSYPAHKMVSVDFPTSEVSDLEGKSRALLGVKHADVCDQLGLPREEVARRLGFNSYRKKRLKRETELKNYPELKSAAELESMQSQNGEDGLEKPAVVKPKEEPAVKK